MTLGKKIPGKSFSLFDSTAVVIGIIIGAGIFKFPTLIAMNVSSGKMIAVVWILGGLISFIGALCYAELATAYPDAGGDYHFLSKAYGDKLSFVFAWTRMMVIQPGSIVMMAFIAGSEFSGIVSLGEFSDSIYAFFSVAILTGLNIAGIKKFNNTQKTLTIAIISGLIAIFILGFFVSSPAVTPPTVAAFDGGSFGKFGMAMVFVLLTFGGWNEAAYISSEIKDPEKNIVRSFLIGIVITTIIYLIVNLALFRALGLEGMRSFDSYYNLVEQTLGRSFTPVIRILIITAALSTANVTVITGARSNYALGRDYKIFKFLEYWNSKTEAPGRALMFQALVSFSLVILGTFYKSGLESMVDYTAPAFWFFFLLSGISLFVMRFKDSKRNRPFKVPFYPLTPILFILFCIYMLGNSLIYTGKGAIFSVAVIISGGLAVTINHMVSKVRKHTDD